MAVLKQKELVIKPILHKMANIEVGISIRFCLIHKYSLLTCKIDTQFLCYSIKKEKCKSAKFLQLLTPDPKCTNMIMASSKYEMDLA